MSTLFWIYRSPGAAMDVTVAISAERNQIFVCIVTQPTPRANVVDLEMLRTAAILASPAIAPEHFGAELTVRICVEPKSPSSRLEIVH